MNQELEKFIQPVIDNHKIGTSSRMDWGNAQREIAGLRKSDKEALRLGMIRLGIIEAHPAGQNAYTLLIMPDFDLQRHKSEKEREASKQWYDTENARLQYEEFPKIRERSRAAIIISICALLITIALGLLELRCK
jgi:hypothetical protein